MSRGASSEMSLSLPAEFFESAARTPTRASPKSKKKDGKADAEDSPSRQRLRSALLLERLEASDAAPGPGRRSSVGGGATNANKRRSSSLLTGSHLEMIAQGEKLGECC